MLADQIREAVPRTLRKDLPHLAATLWKAFAAGAIGESEAQTLAETIEAAKAVPIARPSARAASATWRGGSRPRTSESLERRRRWASAGRLPPQLAAGFTLAEAAVLAVVAAQVARGGDCRLTIGHLAALAGVSATTVRNALRGARRTGLVTIEERRLSAWRNASNIVRIASREWSTWCRLHRAGDRQSEGRVQNSEAHAYGFKDHDKDRALHSGLGRREEGSSQPPPSDRGRRAR